jgi:hypothetical protein
MGQADSVRNNLAHGNKRGWKRGRAARIKGDPGLGADVVGSRGQPLIGRVVQSLGEKLRRADLDQSAATG